MSPNYISVMLAALFFIAFFPHYHHTYHVHYVSRRVNRQSISQESTKQPVSSHGKGCSFPLWLASTLSATPSSSRDMDIPPETERATIDNDLLKLLAQPLLSEGLIKAVVRQWTTPLPTSYLNRPLIITGPSGAGKGRLTSELLKDYQKFFYKIVSYTTRKPRKKEIDGKQYHFLTEEEFHRLNQSEFFLETARIHNHSYGISRHSWYFATQNSSGLVKIRKSQRSLLDREAALFYSEVWGGKGSDNAHLIKIPLLEIDLQGVKFFQEHKELRVNPQYIFIQPPSLAKLEERLIERGSETIDELKLRLSNADADLKYIQEHQNLFHRILVNEDLSLTSNAFFRSVRDWYPALPAASTMGFLKRRVKNVKALITQHQQSTMPQSVT